MKKLISVVMMMLLLVGCASNNQPNNNDNNDDEKREGEVTTPIDNDDDQDDQALLDHNEIAQQVQSQVYLLKNNEILVEVNHQGEDDFNQLFINLTLFEKDSDVPIDYEASFNAFSAGSKSYQFSTQFSDLDLDLKRTITRYSYGNPYALQYGDLSEFVTLNHTKSDTTYSVLATARNEGEQTIEFLSLYTIYYEDGEVVGAHMRFVNDLEKDQEADFDFLAPLDNENRMAMYDDYEIGVRSAYYTKP